MDEVEARKASAEYAQDVTQLALLVIGGTVAILIGDSHLRPLQRGVRWVYFLFAPAWVFLGLAINRGIEVRQSYLAYLWQVKPGSVPETTKAIPQAMNSEAIGQIRSADGGYRGVGARRCEAADRAALPSGRAIVFPGVLELSRKRSLSLEGGRGSRSWRSQRRSGNCSRAA